MHELSLYPSSTLSWIAIMVSCIMNKGPCQIHNPKAVSRSPIQYYSHFLPRILSSFRS